MKPPDIKQLQNGRPGSGGGNYSGQIINKNDVHFSNSISKVPPPTMSNGRGPMDKLPPPSTSSVIPNGRMPRPNSKNPRLPIDVSHRIIISII